MSDFVSPQILVMLAILIVIALAAVAGYYLWQVHLLNQKRKAQMDALKQAGMEQRVRVNKSIQVIAQAITEDQMTLTEGAIRLRVLMDGISVSDDQREEFSAFFQLAAATEHIPILDAWKALSTKKKLEFDSERERIEADYKDFVMDAARRVLGREF